MDKRREMLRQGRLLDRLTRQFERSIAREIAAEMRAMVAFWELTGEVPSPTPHLNRLTAIYQAMGIASVALFGERIKDGAAIKRKDFAATLTEIALRYIASEAVRRRIVQVAETTRSQIIAGVARGFADGLGQQGVAKAITDLIPTLSRARANLIARTETHGAANAGALGAARETGLRMMREWISSDDDSTRPDHAAANGQVVGMDEPFIVGGVALMYPGDPDGPADQTINCRCAVGFVPE